MASHKAARCNRERLERQILAALKQAMKDGRTAIADHLLNALEALAPECEPGTVLAYAYMTVADTVPSSGSSSG